jgi:hypothetical protein
MKQRSLRVRTRLQAGGWAKYLCEDNDTTCGAHDIATGQPRDDIFKCQSFYQGAGGKPGYPTGTAIRECRAAIAAAGLAGRVDCYKC